METLPVFLWVPEIGLFGVAVAIEQPIIQTALKLLPQFVLCRKLKT
jgi:hypothetical protein